LSSSITITKASGVRVPFSPHKLEHSLKRAGASDTIIQAIVQKISSSLFEGITTKEIYRIAFNLLKSKAAVTAAKYKLKQAIMELGPSGFPFERYFAEILKYQGFNTKVGEIVKGHCVNHEIDVIAEKDEKHFMIECKFHHQSGYACDVKIPLYIQSRFKDVEHSWIKLPGHNHKFHQGWVVTNTKFTTDAIQYGSCIGLHLVGWDFPKKDSLREQIDKSGLYPVTCLTTLTGEEKSKLLALNVVLCKEIGANRALLLKIGITPGRAEHILKESAEVCANGLK
jgi:Holliday junction resolvase